MTTPGPSGRCWQISAHQKTSAEEKSDIELTRINVGDDSWRGEADVSFGANGRYRTRGN